SLIHLVHAKSPTHSLSETDYVRKADFGIPIDLGECLDDALTEIRRVQMADKPPSTDNSTPFTKLESSEARNSATVAISSGRPIVSRGITDSNIRFASSVRTWSCIGVAIGPGLSTFTRIFLPFSSLSQVRANERNAALLAEYTPYPGNPFTEATDPVMKIDPPSLNSGNAFWTVNIVPRVFRPKAASKCCSVISPSGTASPVPALAYRTSILPFSRLTVSKRRSRSSRLAASPCTPVPFRPISFTALSSV